MTIPNPHNFSTETRTRLAQAGIGEDNYAGFRARVNALQQSTQIGGTRERLAQNISVLLPERGLNANTLRNISSSLENLAGYRELVQSLPAAQRNTYLEVLQGEVASRAVDIANGITSPRIHLGFQVGEARPTTGSTVAPAESINSVNEETSLPLAARGAELRRIPSPGTIAGALIDPLLPLHLRHATGRHSLGNVTGAVIDEAIGTPLPQTPSTPLGDVFRMMGAGPSLADRLNIRITNESVSTVPVTPPATISTSNPGPNNNSRPGAPIPRAR